MNTGKIRWFNPTKGYGFIMQDNDDQDLFVHANNIDKDIPFESLREGFGVRFEIGDGNLPENKQALKVRRA